MPTKKFSLPHHVWSWAFLSPAIVLLVLFSILPVVWGSYLAFTEYKLISPPTWIGLKNFYDILDDSIFWISIKNSLYYLIIVPFIQITAIAVAVLVNHQIAGIKFIRAAIYMPVLTSVSVIGIMWGWMYNEDGLLNQVLAWLHLINEPVGWLSDERIALFSVMFVTWWRGLGWYMVLYLAALQAIPKEIEEAAILDGAGRWRRFWKITMPIILPTILLCSVLSSLSAIKVLEEVLILTKGGPISSTYIGLYYVYDQGVRAFNFPRALAASLIISIFCILIAWLNFHYIQPRHSKTHKI